MNTHLFEKLCCLYDQVGSFLPTKPPKYNYVNLIEIAENHRRLDWDDSEMHEIWLWDSILEIIINVLCDCKNLTKAYIAVNQIYSVMCATKTGILVVQLLVMCSWCVQKPSHMHNTYIVLGY